MAECAPPYTASDSDNSDSESSPTELQTPPSLDRVKECIQELRTFALDTDNGTFLDRVMGLQDMSITCHIKDEFVTKAKQDKLLLYVIIYIYIYIYIYIIYIRFVRSR